jgi:hypothetical protein
MIADSMKKTCLLFVVGLCLATVAYFLLIRRYLPEIPLIPSVGLAVLGGFSVLALFGAVSNFIQGLSDKTVLSRAIKRTPFSDGKRAAAIGRVEPSGLATLTSPFSGRDCLAYEYEVYEYVTMRSSKGVSTTHKNLYCSGFGMIPSQIRTNQGDIRILGFPLMDEFPKDHAENPEDRARAGAFMAQTKFKNIKKNFGGIFSEFDDLFRDADGAVRKDLGEAVSIQEKHQLSEIIVPSGVEVCAFGVYSKRDNALIAKTAALPIRLIPGNAAEAEKRLRKTGFSQIAIALVFFLIINGVFALIYGSSQKKWKDIPESEQWKLIHQTAEARDFEKLAKLFQNGVKPDATDSQSRTLLQTTPDDEVARLLLKFGANPNVEDPATLDTPIFEAARTGNAPRIKILIEGGANVNAVCAIPWKHTAIDEAIRAGQYEATQLLMQAGATDPRVTAANGRPLAANGGEELAVCRQYLRAIQSQDKEKLKSLTTPRYEYFFDDIDFAVWKARYPITIETFEGYTNDSAATIQFLGKSADDRESEWIYHMVKEPDGWKIHQTWPLAGGGYEIIWR